MMAPEPLRSAMTVRSEEDTSLAVPSDNKLRSGQQRVLDQVHSIKRKSRRGKNDSVTISPTDNTSPILTTHSDSGTFKFPQTKANGIFSRSFSTKSTSYNKAISTQKSRTLSCKGLGGRHSSSSGTWEQQIKTSNWPQSPNELKPSRSDPALVSPFSPVPASTTVMRARGQTVKSQHMSQQTTQTRVQRQSTHSITNGNQMTNSQTCFIRTPSVQSHTDGRMNTIKTSKAELQQAAVNSEINMSDITLKEAIEYLSHSDEVVQEFGAAFIQHITFKEEQAKEEVSLLGGIPILVELLQSSNPGLSQAVAAALRNLVFQNSNNKRKVGDCDGIEKAVELLKKTDSTETQRQITGLLWNLSPDQVLRDKLIGSALPALTDNVVVPFTSWSEDTSNNNIHPDVFYNATGCLRNLSSGKPSQRCSMRQRNGLIDSLMRYLQSCVTENNYDDQSVENSMCILHNLSYQLEEEAPECFRMYSAPGRKQSGSQKSPTVGCFSPRSTKAQKKFSYDLNISQDSSVSGQGWLCHRKAMEVYLSLLNSSKTDGTAEACCGALQNITAGSGEGSTAMSRILIENLNALFQITPHMTSSNKALQKMTMFLLNNMSRVSPLQESMARPVLPKLGNLISSGPKGMGNCDDTIASACNTFRNLMTANTDVSKDVINEELVNKLRDLHENTTLRNSSKAASVLLYSLWNDRSVYGIVKKLGLPKEKFADSSITEMLRSMQIIE